MNFPQPTTRKQVKSFLGLIGYYRQHIPSFATITQPLNAISGNTSPRLVQWNPTLDKAFKQAKQAFQDAPIISAPNLNLPYHMHTDACSTGIGATLTQVQEGKTKHITKQLTQAEAHYSATELETFAITCAIKHFAVYLHGSFTNIYSDHKQLQHLPTMANDNNRLMRWVGILQQFPHWQGQYCRRLTLQILGRYSNMGSLSGRGRCWAGLFYETQHQQGQLQDPQD